MKKLLYSIATAIACIGALASCSSEPDSPTPVTPDTPSTGGGTTTTVTAKPRLVWIDAAGNFERFANDRDAIASDLQLIKDAGFTGIVVDVRPTTGDVLFNSNTASAVKRLDVWNSQGYVWVTRTATWDYLQEFITVGHNLGLKVNASINAMVGGYLCPYGLGSEGMLFSDASKKSWATVVNTTSGLTSTMDQLDYTQHYGAKFLNPANDEVQTYILSLLGELAQYNLDGIILDRCRYSDDGLLADFSDESRTKFESFINEKVTNWPADVMAPGTTTPGKHYKKWLAFRAHIIHDFIVKARTRVRSTNGQCKFGVYVGGWYSTYYTSGVNWASPNYDPSTVSSYSSWASAEYKNYGFADHLDMLLVGAYASASSIYGSGEWTMAGFCKQAKTLVGTSTDVLGGPDIGNADGWVNGGQASKIPQAVDACISNCDGMFVFDLCHIRSYNYWSAFKTGFDNYLNSLK